MGCLLSFNTDYGTPLSGRRRTAAAPRGIVGHCDSAAGQSGVEEIAPARRALPHAGISTATVSGTLPDPHAIDYRAATGHPAGLGGTIVADAIETYDFIVTGAGSAGWAGAGRLSESGKYRVLLLEAGIKDSNPWIHIPLGYTRTFTDPRVNWMFDSEPEPQLNGRILYQPRGKVLGGTSSINGMVYMRGTPTDYDGWRQKGCEGWGYDMCCRSSRRPKTSNAAPTSFTGWAARCMSPTRCAARSAMRWFRRRSRLAFRPTMISMAPDRRAWAITRRRPPTAGAGVRRAPISVPPRAAPI